MQIAFLLCISVLGRARTVLPNTISSYSVISECQSRIFVLYVHTFKDLCEVATSFCRVMDLKLCIVNTLDIERLPRSSSGSRREIVDATTESHVVPALYTAWVFDFMSLAGNRNRESGIVILCQPVDFALRRMGGAPSRGFHPCTPAEKVKSTPWQSITNLIAISLHCPMTMISSPLDSRVTATCPKVVCSGFCFFFLVSQL